LIHASIRKPGKHPAPGLQLNISYLKVTIPDHPDSEFVFTAEDNYRIWDIGVPVEFPAQPPETK
jgi:hypothetical protein